MLKLVHGSRFTVHGFKKSVNGQLSTGNCFSNGFTLIEFLVVLGLLVLTVGSTLLFLTSILKGSNKATVTAEAKQNGQIVLDSLEKKIRNAVSVIPLSETGIPLSPINQIGIHYIGLTQSIPDGKNLYIKCISSVAGASNGLIGAFEATSPPSEQTLKNNPITNTDVIAGVDIGECSFDVLGPSDGGTSSFIVTIRFTVNQGILAPSRKDFVANVQLQTSIALRQYNQ